MIIEFQDIPVFYSDEGDGQIFMLLHGFLENSSMWDDLKSKLIANGNRVICIDLLGHGQTGCLAEVHAMDLMAKAVHYVIDHLNLKDITLIGHSMGGYVSLALAEARPDLINKLVLMNSTFLTDSNEKKRNRDRAIEAVKSNSKLFVGTSITNLFAEHNRVKFQNEIDAVKKEALKTSVQGITAALEGMKIRPDRTHVLQNENLDKYVIVGKEDPVLDYETLITHLKDLEVQIIEFPDGHMSHLENKEEITHKIIHLSEK